MEGGGGGGRVGRGREGGGEEGEEAALSTVIRAQLKSRAILS